MKPFRPILFQLSLAALIQGCSFGEGMNEWPSMAEVGKKAPQFKDAALAVNLELQERGLSPSHFLPEIDDREKGSIKFHLHNFKLAPKAGGLDIEYNSSTHKVVSVTEWGNK